MAQDPKPVDEDDVLLQATSSELARAIWDVVMVSRNDAKARGLLGQAKRRALVVQILKLARAVRRR
jgi:hypothetical protein